MKDKIIKEISNSIKNAINKQPEEINCLDIYRVNEDTEVYLTSLASDIDQTYTWLDITAANENGLVYEQLNSEYIKMDYIKFQNLSEEEQYKELYEVSNRLLSKATYIAEELSKQYNSSYVCLI